MIQGQPSLLLAFNHYCQAVPKFNKQTIKEAIKYITREISSNPADNANVSSINNMMQDEMMEINTQLIQNQAAQEAMINQLMAKVNAMLYRSSMSRP